MRQPMVMKKLSAGVVALGEGQERHGRQEEREGRAELRPHRHHPAFALRGVLRGEQRRAGPLATDGEALEEAGRDQQGRRPDADAVFEHAEGTGRVARQKTDTDRRSTHDEQRPDQRALAADPVAEVAEDDRADGPGEEGDGERREGRQHRGIGVCCREEDRREDQRCRGPEDEEVVELDRRTDRTRGRDPLQRGLAGLGRFGLFFPG
ncbi:hypothetical protein BJY21_004046 [Kineosphaera limosa]|nr:hypothetical protein [Kineosphaera limosa]NYE02862.1 hypothetical protein [Kineosphaera limosa]